MIGHSISHWGIITSEDTDMECNAIFYQDGSVEQFDEDKDCNVRATLIGGYSVFREILAGKSIVAKFDRTPIWLPGRLPFGIEDFTNQRKRSFGLYWSI